MDVLATKSELFKNPQKLPLNELYLITKDIKLQSNHHVQKKYDNEKYPAIHEVFIDKQKFPLYEVYYWNAETNETNADAFLKNCQKYIEALDFLLQLNYHQFWCYVIKNVSTVYMLNSFLSNFSPSVDLYLMDRACAQLATIAMQKVGTILRRLFTYKHSEVEHMAPAIVMQYLEDSGLLTFEGVLSICMVYRKRSPALVNEIGNSYFHLNKSSQWLHEMTSFTELALMVLACTKHAICGDPDDSIIESLGIFSQPMDLCWQSDILSLIVGTLSTLQVFLEYCPAPHKELLKSVTSYLPKFYEPVFMALYKFLRAKSEDIDRQKATDRIFPLIVIARKLCIDTFHILTDDYINSIATTESHEMQTTLVEQYLKVINGILEEELFLFDYNTSHDIEMQFDIIRAYYADLDTTQTDYIRKCLNTLPKLSDVVQRKQESQSRAEKEVEACAASTSTPRTGPKQHSAEERLQIVAGIFPDFPPECIEACLEFCNHDCDTVIRLIMENNLPPHIADMQRTGVLIPPEPVPSVRAYRGKQPGAVDANALLNDKTDRQLKELTLQAVDRRQDMYDDEFDDRLEYEKMRAPFSRDDSKSTEDSDSSEDDGRARRYVRAAPPLEAASSSDARSTRGGFRPFCEDPAKLREQREMAKSSFRGRGGAHVTGSNRDVVGKPKGQGQDDQVTRNRNKKTANKASKGNHNRKRGAAWKASRGMF